MDLKDRTIVITGATGGMGKEIVGVLDAEGANLILVARSEDELQTLHKSLKNEKSSFYSCDLTNQKAVEELGKTLSEKFSVIDVLINAAGIGTYKPIEDLTLDDWNNSININLTSPFILTKVIVENLKRSEEAVVLNMGSGNGVIPVGGRSSYCTTKFALRGWSLSMSEEFKGTKVDFVLMTLGSVLTSFGPMSYEEKKRDMESGKGYLTPDWVAEKIIEILKSRPREEEYRFYPSGYEPQN
jgi:short-subunit dehydrogenase